MKRLVLVESPTKAKTIRKFLPKEYQVEACMGHIRDLPGSASEIPAKYKGEKWARLGVNVEKNFEPLYVVSSDKKKIVAEIKEALKSADELYIATDEDREGESIGWHLLEVLKPKVPIKRMVFHEITKEAIMEALRKTRQVDTHLVNAQETRRILDRLVGYTVSPLLWRKVIPKLSAGRVQSVAVRLLVLRERERMVFIVAFYWDLRAQLVQSGKHFEATMTHLNGRRLATGKDFDDHTGMLKQGNDALLLTEAEARALSDRLFGERWKVVQVEERLSERRPYAPFITSTLQQEANRKLRLPARQTMRLAQSLYERGLITYMRTDSTNLSNEAIEAARNTVLDRYGKEYLSPAPRQFASKSKNAQEAHEAIRPAGTAMQTAKELALMGDEAALYDLIWKRTVASQMADAKLKFTAATIEAGHTDVATFRASGRTVVFPGFFRAYVEGSDDPDAALDDKEQPLPDLKKGDQPNCRKVEAIGHETKPPARYTEASLVQTLESEGIGRPSTYASIMDTIVERGYVRRQANQLIPTFTAFATTQLLEENFAHMVDVRFTADMEQVLDDISEGSKKALPYLESLYNGAEGLEKKVERGLDQIDARAVSTIRFHQWEPYCVRVGKFGAYLELEEAGERITAPIPDEVAPADLSKEDFASFINKKQMGDEVLGIHPELDQPIFVKKGPYGEYVQLGEDEGKPKRVSLPKGMTMEQVTLDMALELLRLPRNVGNHPDTGKPIIANVGRFGPYVQHVKTFASLAKTDDVLTVGLERALILIAAKEGKKAPIRVLGVHPQSKEPVEVWEGRYGPYVSHQKTNATLPKDLTPDSVTFEEAMQLLIVKEVEGPAKKTARRTTRKK
ncbi:MAG TPA: type I DNA topoisomerase [Bacteroidetes bacterium]|nr:type I DNA topoisomerase [Bacteroidota bacterium]HRR07772.1 type I DNA topoisomerase [Rhodothermales bacterium]